MIDDEQMMRLIEADTINPFPDYGMTKKVNPNEVREIKMLSIIRIYPNGVAYPVSFTILGDQPWKKEKKQMGEPIKFKKEDEKKKVEV